MQRTGLDAEGVAEGEQHCVRAEQDQDPGPQHAVPADEPVLSDGAFERGDAPHDGDRDEQQVRAGHAGDAPAGQKQAAGRGERAGAECRHDERDGDAEADGGEQLEDERRQPVRLARAVAGARDVGGPGGPGCAGPPVPSGPRATLRDLAGLPGVRLKFGAHRAPLCAGPASSGRPGAPCSSRVSGEVLPREMNVR